MTINIQVTHLLAIMAGVTIVGDVVTEKVVKPTIKKLKESRNGVKVTIDGEPVEATVVGA